jgi:hypothetical protein
MYDEKILAKIRLLGYVIDDVKDLDNAISQTSDPSLLMEYKQEMRGLITELNEVSFRVIDLLDEYLADCREKGSPISLDYYRVWKELSKAKNL